MTPDARARLADPGVAVSFARSASDIIPGMPWAIPGMPTRGSVSASGTRTESATGDRRRA